MYTCVAVQIEIEIEFTTEIDASGLCLLCSQSPVP